jgi:hypothetical protein
MRRLDVVTQAGSGSANTSKQAGEPIFAVFAARCSLVRKLNNGGGNGKSGIGLPLTKPRGLSSSAGGAARYGASGAIAPSESTQFAKRSSNVVGRPGAKAWGGERAVSDAPLSYAVGSGDAPIRRLRYRIGLLVPGPLKLSFGSGAG